MENEDLGQTLHRHMCRFDQSGWSANTLQNLDVVSQVREQEVGVRILVITQGDQKVPEFDMGHNQRKAM